MNKIKKASYALEYIFNTADYLWVLGDENARILNTAGNDLVSVLDDLGIECSCEEFKGKKAERRKQGQLGTIATVTHEPGRWLQVSYEGRDPDVNRIRQIARRRGLKVSSGSMGPQVTPAGVVKLNMMTIRGDTDEIYDEIEELKRKAVF